MLAVAMLASVLLAGCSHTSVKANAAGSERGYSSNGEAKLGMPF
jgi:outer membrane murein-binding lipoprotein Lpp